MSQYSPIRKRLRSSRHEKTTDDVSDIDLFIIDAPDITLTDLPIIIQYKIFAYLDAKTLLTKVQRVCKYFEHIIKDKSLWKSFRCLNFEENENLSFIITIIKKCKNLKHLKIERKIGQNFDYDKKTLHSCLFDILAHYVQLRSLSLSNFRIGLDCEDSFTGFMKSLPNLIHLDLDKCYVSNSIAEIIAEGSSLKTLCLSRCYSIENQTFIKIFQSCKQLEHLNLSQQDALNDKVFQSLFTICAENIQVLYLKDISVQYHNLIQIKNCTKLSVLSIDCHFLNDKTLSQMKKLNHLKCLELSFGLLFSSVGLRKFFEEGSFSKLKHLDLTCCAGLENPTLEVLVEKCRELESLDLSECWRITDKGIFYVIRKCTHLRLLNLEDLKELKGVFLIEIHTHLRKLLTLNLSFCDGISSYFLQQFIKLNPTVKVKRCKEYRVKPVININSSPVLLISQGMLKDSSI